MSRLYGDEIDFFGKIDLKILKSLLRELFEAILFEKLTIRPSRVHHTIAIFVFPMSKNTFIPNFKVKVLRKNGMKTTLTS